MTELCMLVVGKSLGEDVCNHIIGRAEDDLCTLATHKVIPEVVVFAADVFCSSAELRLLREDNRAHVVAVDDGGSALLLSDLLVKSA